MPQLRKQIEALEQGITERGMLGSPQAPVQRRGYPPRRGAAARCAPCPLAHQISLQIFAVRLEILLYLRKSEVLRSTCIPSG